MMRTCEQCRNMNDCANAAIERGCDFRTDFEGEAHCLNFKPPMTNGDRIRAMSDEQLADFFILRDSMKKFHGEVLVSGCVIPENMLNSMNEITRIAWLHWLKQTAEVE